MAATAQTDSSFTDTLTALNGVEDATGEDSTGYYFNWKEHPADRYAVQHIRHPFLHDSAIRAFREEDDFWYVKSVEDFKKNQHRIEYDKQYRDSLAREGLLPSENEVFTQQNGQIPWYQQEWFLRFLWFVIIGVFVSALLYFLMANKISLFRSASAKMAAGISDNMDSSVNLDYGALLVKYKEDKNYRLAVRILYLQLLQLLNEKHVITYQANFTDSHYLKQLEKSPFYHSFYGVTRHYEYVWYGGFQVSYSQFEKIETDFIHLTQKLKQ